MRGSSQELTVVKNGVDVANPSNDQRSKPYVLDSMLIRVLRTKLTTEFHQHNARAASKQLAFKSDVQWRDLCVGCLRGIVVEFQAHCQDWDLHLSSEHPAEHIQDPPPRDSALCGAHLGHRGKSNRTKTESHKTPIKLCNFSALRCLFLNQNYHSLPTPHIMNP
eukprot:6176674-Amphidinium_carterae.1